MRFMCIRRADESTEAGLMPDTGELERMGKYMEEATKAGILLAADGLHPTSKGALVRFTNGKPRVIDGPFTEAKELVAGWAIIDVPSKQDAIEWAKRWPAVGREANVALEIRQVFEADDFGPEFTPEQRAAEERMRAEIAKR